MTKYAELRLRIDRGVGRGSYRIVATGPAGEALGRFKLPFSDMELENFILKVGATRRGRRRIDSPEMELAKNFGSRLFEALFEGDVRELYRSSFSETRGAGQGLRVTLSLTGAPELLQVPWEYMYDHPSFLSISTWTPIVRYLDLPKPRRPLQVSLPIRILAMVSSPSDAEVIDAGQERAKLEAALAPLIATGAIAIDWLEEASLRALQRQLRRGEYHVFHFIGHGGYDQDADDGVLLFQDEVGRGRRVSGIQLGTILADEVSLRLAVLNSCEGARSSLQDPFSGVATSLIEREIPAVIGMQFEITDRAAIVFAGEFYSALADGLPVDSSVAEARKAIYADQNDIEWGTPVLFMRVADGRLFDVQSHPPIRPAEASPVAGAGSAVDSAAPFAGPVVAAAGPLDSAAPFAGPVAGASPSVSAAPGLGAGTPAVEPAADHVASRERERERSDEDERIARAEAEAIQREREAAAAAAVAEQLERERREAERVAREAAEAAERQRAEAEAQRLEAERIEQERVSREAAEAAELERAEAERLEAERIEQERVSREAAEAAELKRAEAEAQRLEAERIEQQRAARAAADAAEAAELKRAEAEQLEAARIERERFVREAAERQRAEAEAQRLQAARAAPVPFELRWAAGRAALGSLVGLVIASVWLASETTYFDGTTLGDVFNQAALTVFFVTTAVALLEGLRPELRVPGGTPYRLVGGNRWAASALEGAIVGGSVAWLTAVAFWLQQGDDKDVRLQSLVLHAAFTGLGFVIAEAVIGAVRPRGAGLSGYASGAATPGGVTSAVGGQARAGRQASAAKGIASEGRFSLPRAGGRAALGSFVGLVIIWVVGRIVDESDYVGVNPDILVGNFVSEAIFTTITVTAAVVLAERSWPALRVPGGSAYRSVGGDRWAASGIEGLIVGGSVGWLTSLVFWELNNGPNQFRWESLMWHALFTGLGFLIAEAVIPSLRPRPDAA